MNDLKFDNLELNSVLGRPTLNLEEKELLSMLAKDGSLDFPA